VNAKDNDFSERLVRMEERQAIMERLQARSMKDSEEIERQLSAIHRRMDKQYSFVGGIVFAVTAFWSIVTLCFEFFTNMGHRG
jgi:hypothetical protein